MSALLCCVLCLRVRPADGKGEARQNQYLGRGVGLILWVNATRGTPLTDIAAGRHPEIFICMDTSACWTGGNEGMTTPIKEWSYYILCRCFLTCVCYDMNTVIS